MRGPDRLRSVNREIFGSSIERRACLRSLNHEFVGGFTVGRPRTFERDRLAVRTAQKRRRRIVDIKLSWSRIFAKHIEISILITSTELTSSLTKHLVNLREIQKVECEVDCVDADID